MVELRQALGEVVLTSGTSLDAAIVHMHNIVQRPGAPIASQNNITGAESGSGKLSSGARPRTEPICPLVGGLIQDR